MVKVADGLSDDGSARRSPWRVARGACRRAEEELEERRGVALSVQKPVATTDDAQATVPPRDRS